MLQAVTASYLSHLGPDHEMTTPATNLLLLVQSAGVQHSGSSS